MILPVPHFQQKRDGDCLPACASMVLAYMSKKPPLWLLRWLLGSSAIGTPFSRIRRLERLGVVVHVSNKGNRSLLSHHLSQNQPCIVPVETGDLPYWNRNTFHALVVVGLENDVIYVNDPNLDHAPIGISYADFDLAWLAQDEHYAVLLSP